MGGNGKSTLAALVAFYISVFGQESQKGRLMAENVSSCNCEIVRLFPNPILSNSWCPDMSHCCQILQKYSLGKKLTYFAQAASFIVGCEKR